MSKEKAMEAVRRMFGDTTVSPEETLDALQEIREEIDVMIEAIEKDGGQA